MIKIHADRYFVSVDLLFSSLGGTPSLALRYLHRVADGIYVIVGGLSRTSGIKTNSENSSNISSLRFHW